MTIQVTQIDGLHRLVDEKGKIAKHKTTGKPLDGGPEKCGPDEEDLDRKERQAGHINEGEQRKPTTLNE